MKRGVKKRLFSQTYASRVISALCICSMVFCLVSGAVPAKSTAAATDAAWLASEDYSSVQGENQWYYIFYKVRGETVKFNYMSKYISSSIPELGNTIHEVWHVDYLEYINLSKNTQVGTDGDSAARAWKAPNTGKVFMSGEPCFTSGNGNSFGTNFQIILKSAASDGSTKTLWEEIDYKDTQPLSYRFSVNVTEGDMVYFLATTNGENTRTRVTWDPKIIYVPDENSAPKFSEIAGQTAKAGYKMTFFVEASDENYDVLTYSSDNLPKGARLNKKTGEVKWTPKKAQIGTYDINFTVSDGELTDTTTVRVSVEKVPLVRLEITGMPAKTEYLTGESFSMEGLVVTGVFKNGDRITMSNITMDNISGFNSEIESKATLKQTLTVSVKGLTASFPVFIVYSPLSPVITLKTAATGLAGIDAAEVNQEVFFTAEATTYYGDTANDSSKNAALLKIAQYEWDFGDGYKVSGNSNGIMATHYYMRPGTFTIKLTVSLYPSYREGIPTGDLIVKRMITKQITVTGTEPLDGFELLHAPFNARIAQFILLDVPEDVAADPKNRLEVRLTGSDSTNLLLYNETNLYDGKRFLLEQRNLSAGEYTLTALLLDSSGNIITDGDKQGIWTEKFVKDYDGIPRVGINEWNAICIDGEPTFPITTFMTNNEKFEGQDAVFAGCINGLYTIGWYPGSPYHETANYVDYLKRAEANNLTVIGAGTCGIYGRGRTSRNRGTLGIQTFASAAAESDALLMHTWADEPNLGGKNVSVSLPVLSAWKYATEEVDRQHPTALNMYGYDYLPFTSKGTEYFYINSTRYNDRHSFYTDVLTCDVYPMVIRKHFTLKNKERGLMDMYAQCIDNKVDTSMGLIPTGMFIEVCNDWKYEEKNGKVPDPSSAQVLMEAWLAVVHGVKMVNWFPFFTYSTIRYDAMREFTTAMKTYEKIVLSRDDVVQVTDDSNVRTNRVDTLTRMDGDDIYLFTVRLTEPEPIEGEEKHLAYPEPETITTTFTVPGITSGIAEVLDNRGKVIKRIAVSNGQFSDIFEKEACHIYRIAGR